MSGKYYSAIETFRMKDSNDAACAFALAIVCFVVIVRLPGTCSYMLAAVAGGIMFYELQTHTALGPHTPMMQRYKDAVSARKTRGGTSDSTTDEGLSVENETDSTPQVNETDDEKKSAKGFTSTTGPPSGVVFGGSDIRKAEEMQMERWKKTHMYLIRPSYKVVNGSLDAFHTDMERLYNMGSNDAHYVVEEE